MAQQNEKELLAEIAALKSKLAESEREKTEAQQLSAAMAEASAFGGTSEEQPTGNSIEVSKCANPWVKDEKKQKWATVKLPTYFYTVTLPKGAGVSLTTNGIDYYHGQTYELDADTLTDLKSRVARCWEHEKSIHGDNENAYRKPTNRHLVSAAAMQRGVMPN